VKTLEFSHTGPLQHFTQELMKLTTTQEMHNVGRVF